MPAARLTVAIPLHRSAPWVENIIENIRTMPANTRVLLSDATSEDDALPTLRRRLRRDRRVHVLRHRSNDGGGWREHCNRLLVQADTELFAWLPHDDVLTAGYYVRLVEALDRMPTAALAFGPMTLIGGPFDRPYTYPPRPVPAGTDLPEYEAVLLARHWNLGITFRGVVRRHLARPIPASPRDQFSDVYWSFGVALSGHLVEVDDAVYVKRMHDEMITKRWRAIPIAEYVEGCARQIHAGSPVHQIAPDVEARLRAAFTDGPDEFPWV